MLKVLTFDVPRLVTLLRTGYFRSLGVRVITACSADMMLERTVWLIPDLVLLVDDRIPPGFAPAMRACLGERRTQMVLVVGGDCAPPDDDDLTAYDSIVSLADPELELARLVTLQAPRSRRRQSRNRLRLPVELGVDHKPSLGGALLDVSSDGAGLLLARLPKHAGPHSLRFHRRDGRNVVVSARVVWADARTDPAVRVGVKLLDMSAEMSRALADLALWELDVEAGEAVIRLHGELDERADLSPLLAHAGPSPILDLGDVVRANSVGLLRWTTFLRQFPSETSIRLRRVPATLMRQFSLVPLATLGCTIESYHAPYECEACEVDIDLLVGENDARASQPCPLCNELLSYAEPQLRLAAR